MKIIAKNIGKSYRHQDLFSHINFELEPNEILGISGKNGSGKSTLLKIIAGNVTPTLGQVIFLNQDNVISDGNKHNYIVIAAPYLDLPMDMTLEDLWHFHFELKPKKKSIHLSSMTKEFGLPLQKSLRDFSSGMVQRAKLVLAFTTDVNIILFDEPTELLDHEGIALFYKWIKKLEKHQMAIISSNKPTDFVNCKHIIDISNK